MQKRKSHTILSPPKKLLLIAFVILAVAAVGMKAADVDELAFRGPRTIKGADGSRSTTIDITKNGRTLVNVNAEANTVTVFRVESNTLEKLAEVPVGEEPHSVAIDRNNLAYVTNSQSGTVSVVDLKGEIKVVNEISVGSEPRGCALTPRGSKLFVANFTSGTVDVIDTDTQTVVDSVVVGGNPYAVAVTDSGGGDDNQTVFVTRFLARLVAGGPGEGFDNGKEAIVSRFSNDGIYTVSDIVLSPLADSGFTVNRTNQCLPPTGTGTKDTFCPQPGAPAGDPVITADPQGVFPNQLHGLLLRGNRLFVPNIGAQPEPPFIFNTNVQALVHVIDTVALAQVTALHVNLNNQIKTEPPADPATLDRTFGNDIVAMEANRDGDEFLILSRGGNYVLRATAVNENTPLSIGAPANVIRLQTGNIPTGLVANRDFTRAYVNNEVNMSVSILDLQNNTTLALDVPSSTPPKPGTSEHAALMGKLVFFTALGVPDNELVGAEIRSIVPMNFRNKQSSDAWSTCGSCHPQGLADGVTWIFADGPRQAIPMDGLYSKINGAHDTRINNWSAARDSVTDFNNNSRNVQCGTGFAGGVTNIGIGCPPAGSGVVNPGVFDHGISSGASQALDMETLYAQTIRPLNMPQPVDVSAGRTVFETNCASCHGGAKWSKSQVLYLNNPAYVAGVARNAPGLVINGAQVVSFTDAAVDTGTLTFLDDIGTFDAANPIEIRQNGAAPFGVLGFNSPSLLGVGHNAPYFHNGGAQTLPQVFAAHGLPGGGTIESAIPLADRDALILFLISIDGRTQPLTSDAEVFKNPGLNLP